MSGDLAFTTDSLGNFRQINKRWEYHTGTCQNCRAKGVSVGPCGICKACEKIL
jgi:hypothetical protein